MLNGFLRGQDKTTRVIFMRRFWFGDTTAGIAERLHVSESMVKSRISRTLKKLREYLRKEGYEIDVKDIKKLNSALNDIDERLIEEAAQAGAGRVPCRAG